MSISDDHIPKKGKLSRLLQNFGHFAVGGLVTRLIAIGLVPFYARSLGPAGYGEIELITSTVGLLFPLVSLSLYEGVLRFVMNKALSEKEVMTSAFIMLGVGLVMGSLVFFWLSSFLPGIETYTMPIIVLLILQVCRSVLGQYCRADGDVRGFVLGGVIEAITTAVVAIYALYIMHLGVMGYVLGLAAGHMIAIFFFISRSRIWRVFDVKRFSWSMTKALLKFCLPLMFNGALWWIVNSVNRLFIAEYSGVAEVGLFGVAQKVSSVLAAAIIIFNQAWQMSANEEYSSGAFARYVSAVFNGFHLVTLGACLIITAVAVPLVGPVFGKDFLLAGPLIPLMVLGAALSGSATFIGALHMASMNTRSIMWSSLAAGVAVLLGNYLLVPKFDAIGAAIAAVIGFGVLLVFRLLSVRTVVAGSSVLKMVGSIVLVLVACVPAIVGANSLTSVIAQLLSLAGILYIYRRDVKKTVVMLKRR